MADRQRVYEGRPGLAEWGEDLGELNPRVLRAVRAGVKANVMPASPSGVPFAGLLESTKSLPALPYFLGDLMTGGRYALSESAPQFAVEASDKYDELINRYLAEEGLSESERLPILEKYGLAAGEMLGQLPVPGKMLERMTKTLPKAFKPAGWLAEYFGPTVDPKAVNYAIGTGMGGTLRTATGEEEPEKFAKGGLGRKPIIKRTAEGTIETAPAAATEIRKEPGGNWLPGSVERIVEDLRAPLGTPNARPSEHLRKIDEYIQLNPEMANNPAVTLGRAHYAAVASVDKWLETKLANYIKNDMATERDPVRKGIEQRAAKADESYARGKERITKNQKKIAEAKARGQDTTAVEDRLALEMADLEQKYELDKLAASGRLPNLGYNTLAVIANERNMYGRPQLGVIPQSQAWENITDASVDQGVSDFVKKRPWLPDEYIQELDRIPSGSNVYELRNSNEFNDVLSHLKDELYNSIRNGSDIPPELKLKPEDLNKMNMDAVVAHVGKVDAWRERNRAAADLLKSRNAATVTHKEYPGTGLEWKELKMPEPDPKSKMDLGFERERLLQEALEYEGKVMGHCVGSYCPQVAAGKVQIFSLRDAKGEPHVTIEVRPGNVNKAISKMPDDERIALTQEVKDKYFGGVTPPSMLKGYGSPEESRFFELIDKAYLEKYGPPPAEIVQIKGKGNKKPADKYIPFVQDFVKSGKWSRIKDYENAGLVALNADDMMIRAFVRTGQPLPLYDPSVGTNGKYIMTPEQHAKLTEWFDKGSKAGFTPPEFADGGIVESGNIDLGKLPVVRNPDGSVSTVSSIGIEMDGTHFVIPTIINGRRVTPDQAVDHFKKTHQHLGAFSTREAADIFAQRLHESEAERVGEYDERAIDEIVEPLRRRLEPFLGEARKVPRRIKQAAADVTEIGPIIKRSNEIPLKYFDVSGEMGGEADAMRHLLFQAQLARKYGEIPAKIISNVHEYTTFGQPESQREMDLHNDVLGREIAAKAKSDEDLVRLAEKYVKSGRAKTLPKDQRGGY